MTTSVPLLICVTLGLILTGERLEKLFTKGNLVGLGNVKILSNRLVLLRFIFLTGLCLRFLLFILKLFCVGSGGGLTVGVLNILVDTGKICLFLLFSLLVVVSFSF